jgi:hypothetical protein
MFSPGISGIYFYDYIFKMLGCSNIHLQQIIIIFNTNSFSGTSRPHRVFTAIRITVSVYIETNKFDKCTLCVFRIANISNSAWLQNMLFKISNNIFD